MNVFFLFYLRKNFLTSIDMLFQKDIRIDLDDNLHSNLINFENVKKKIDSAFYQQQHFG